MADIMIEPSFTGKESIDFSNDLLAIQHPDHSDSIANLTEIKASFDAPSSGLNAILEVLESNEQIYDTEAKQFIAERCSRLITSENLTEEWFEVILRYTTEAIRRIWPNVRYHNDSMNINKYLRIQLIDHPDSSLCDYINGVAFFKDVIHKKMDTMIPHPKILLLNGGAELTQNDSKYISMNALISQEAPYT
jgi:hypothetical protein